ncbi:DoxX family protein [Bailinhaonella thermotolerans]|uniref:DoxX family protein n=1 Tax=Bailinhaonella thermotolerans TaxID=1070861 RepID=A0A3A4AV77_9ACTN|nr:hypothetical protein [Bailinhaonella thermotolerans]RJL32175.1 hypothetical protein D5H75_17370 [Bailinhaonella thermotolerans]
MHAIATAALAVFLVAVGVTHFLAPRYFRSLVPTPLARHAGALVALSGVAEIVTGVLVAVPATRALGAWTAAALITGYLSSHLDAARHARRDHPSPLWRPYGVAGRVAVNLLYIAWAAGVALGAA